MKEDILEQLVDDYLQWKGYFTRHNLKFQPRTDHIDYDLQADCVASDIDVLGIHPRLDGPRRVIVVSCKAWQGGFHVERMLQDLGSEKKIAGRDAWKRFRELIKPKWSEAFLTAVEEATGSRQFTYVTAVTSLRGTRDAWEGYPPFATALAGNPVVLWTLSDLLAEIYPAIGTTVANSQLGRTLQLIKASGWAPPAKAIRAVKRRPAIVQTPTPEPGAATQAAATKEASGERTEICVQDRAVQAHGEEESP
jgi:hypothetical protein